MSNATMLSVTSAPDVVVTQSTQNMVNKASDMVLVSLSFNKALTVIGLTGLIVNGLSLVVIFCYTSMRTQPSSFLLINQIAIDCVACVLITAQYSSVLAGDPLFSMFNIYLSNDSLCRFWYSKVVMWCLLNSSNYNIVLLTVERYFRIIHSSTYYNIFTKVGHTTAPPLVHTNAHKSKQSC